MSKDLEGNPSTIRPFEQLTYAREVLEAEAEALHQLAQRLDAEFCRAVDLLLHCRGSLIATGMGKAGLVAQKIAATLASTGTRSHFLHPAEAFHGDLGRIHSDDVLLILSQSGETEEVVRLLAWLADYGLPIVAITSNATSSLGRAATVALSVGHVDEACSLGLAPSTSTTVMMGLGDALALVTSRLRNFRAEDFARFHPGGSLGRKLSKVDHHMRPIAECRVAIDTQSVREVFVQCTKPGRRTGAILLTNRHGKLSGLFTDSDLARLFESRHEASLDSPISRLMTPAPYTVVAGAYITDAIRTMADRKISELPVIDDAHRPIGLVDITDVVSLLPEDDRNVSDHRKSA